MEALADNADTFMLRAFLPRLVATAWMGLVVAPAVFIVALALVDRRAAVIATFGIEASAYGLLSWCLSRWALKRVLPAPAHYRVLPGHPWQRRAGYWTCVIAAIAALSIGSPRTLGNLGMPFGIGIGSALTAYKIRQFERDDGRCIATEDAPWWKPSPHLFAVSTTNDVRPPVGGPNKQEK